MTIVWPTAPIRSLRIAAAALVELGEGVVEKEERWHPAAGGDQLRLGEQEREHGEPLLALRAERAEIAVAGADRDLVEVRAGTRRARARCRGRAAASSAAIVGGSAS